MLNYSPNLGGVRLSGTGWVQPLTHRRLDQDSQVHPNGFLIVRDIVRVFINGEYVEQFGGTTDRAPEATEADDFSCFA
jgi:hypothetical protein